MSLLGLKSLKSSIRTQLLLLILASGLVPVIIFGTISSFQARNTLKADAFTDLTVMVQEKAKQIDRYYSIAEDALLLLAKDNRVVGLLGEEIADPSLLPLDPWLRLSRSTLGFTQVHIVDLDGTIKYSTSDDSLRSRSLIQAALKDTPTGRAFDRARSSATASYPSPFFQLPFTGPSTAMAVPVWDNQRVVGFLICTLTITNETPFISFANFPASTLELVVGTQSDEGVLFLSPLRKSGDRVGTKSIAASSGLAGPMKQAVQGRQGAGMLPDYAGDQVLAAWQQAPVSNLGIVVKLDAAEVLRPVWDMQKASIPAAFLTLLILVASAWWASRQAAIRIKNLEAATRAVAEGQLNTMVSEDGVDEIGDLARSFNDMTRQLATSVAWREDLQREIESRERLENVAKLYTEKLQASNQDLEQFAYVASHDLQEPLRMVASYTQLLERRYADKLDDDAREFIRYAVDGSRRMQQLVNDLLQYSRIPTRGNEFGPVDLHEVAGAALATSRMAPGGTEAVFLVEDLPTVHGDAAQLERLMTNLFTNAVKFHGKDPLFITVSAESHPDEWIISVNDNGIGIAPQFHERIFQIFQRLHGANEYAGTGLGLAICHRVVQRHGGRIWVESDPSIGVGSRFRFSLPKIQTEDQQ